MCFGTKLLLKKVIPLLGTSSPPPSSLVVKLVRILSRWEIETQVALLEQGMTVIHLKLLLAHFN